MYDEFLICLHYDPLKQGNGKVDEKEMRDFWVSFISNLVFLICLFFHGLFSTLDASFFFTFLF